jgi:hypothetical protein
MKSKGSYIAPWAAVLLSLLVFAPNLTRAGEQPQGVPGQVLPEDTIFFLQASPWRTWGAEWKNCPLAKILEEPEVKAFLRAGRPAGPDAPPHAAGEEGQTLAALDKLFPGPLTIALAMPKGPERLPELCVVLGAKVPEGFRSNLGMLTGILSGNDYFKVMELHPYQNQRLMVFPLGLTLCIMETHLIFATHRDQAERLIDGVSGQLPQRLEQKPSFAASGISGQEKLSAYLDVKSLRAALGAEKRKGSDEWLRNLGLEDLQSVSWSISVNEGGFESSAAFATGGPKTGLFAELSTEPLRPEAFAACPPGAPFALGFNSNIAAPEALLARLVAILSGPAAAERMRLYTPKATGYPEALKEGLGAECVISCYLGVDGMPAFWNPAKALLASVSVTDPDQVKLGLMKLFKAEVDGLRQGDWQDLYREFSFNNASIFYLEPKPGVESDIFFALSEKRLLMASNIQTLKMAIRVSAEGKGLNGTDAFKTALAHAGGKLGPMAAYLDWAYFYEGGQTFLTGMLESSTTVKQAFRDIGLDLNLLPTPRAVTKHLFPTLATVQVQEHGFLVRIRSPLPSIEILAPPLAGLTIGIAAFIQEINQPGPKPKPVKAP